MSIRIAFAAAAFAAGGLIALTPLPSASAATLSPHLHTGLAIEMDEALAPQNVQRRQERRWNRQRHGPRYRSQRPGYRHYHQGYWYRTPWWGFSVGIPGIGLGLGVGPGVGIGGNHVAWCQNRYRSYNPSTDQFLGYDGRYRYCNSPYR